MAKTRNAKISAENVEMYKERIAYLESEKAKLDKIQDAINKNRAEIETELVGFKLALKSELGESSTDTSLDSVSGHQGQPDSDVTSRNQQQAVSLTDPAGASQPAVVALTDPAGASQPAVVALTDPAGASQPAVALPNPSGASHHAVALTDPAGASQPAVVALTDPAGASQPAVALTNPSGASHHAVALTDPAAARKFVVAQGLQKSVNLRRRIGALEDKDPVLTLSSHGLTKSEHKQKIKGVEFFSINHDAFVTSSYEGILRKWELTSNTKATKVVSFDGVYKGSIPEDFAINPVDDSIVLVYGNKETLRVVSLTGEEQDIIAEEIAEKYHETGVSHVAFLRCKMNNNPVFVTSDKKSHSIVAWGMVESTWKNVGSYKLHSSAITGICGLFDRPVVVSVGRDQRAIAYDIEKRSTLREAPVRADCFAVAANPIDYNLLCIQTGADERQLKFWDVRSKEILNAMFGWKRSKDSQKTALVKPAWSPSGLLLSCGPAEEKVRVFDIRYCSAKNPSITLSDHSGKVFKVAWAPTRSVLVTTSLNDKKIGLYSLKGDVLR